MNPMKSFVKTLIAGVGISADPKLIPEAIAALDQLDASLAKTDTLNFRNAGGAALREAIIQLGDVDGDRSFVAFAINGGPFALGIANPTYVAVHGPVNPIEVFTSNFEQDSQFFDKNGLKVTLMGDNAFIGFMSEPAPGTLGAVLRERHKMNFAADPRA